MLLLLSLLLFSFCTSFTSSSGPGPFPGIIDMFGGVLPGCNEIRAALLASRGYATLALSYFGGEDQPVWSDVKMLDIEYFEVRRRKKTTLFYRWAGS